MHIKEIISQSRRDFIALYECEHCGSVKQDRGYDDENFHKNVVPRMRCVACNKVATYDYIRIG